MYRAFAPCAAHRASAAAAAVAAGATLTAASRTIAMYTQQSDALANAAKYKGYTSPVWFEQEDLWWIERITAVKADQRPVEVSGYRRIELLNVNQLTSAPEGVAEAATHSSLRKGEPYGERAQKDLSEIAAACKFTSKWWLSPREARSRGLAVRFGENPKAIVTRGPFKVFNVEQFENPERLAQEPVSGASRKSYGGTELGKALLAATQAAKFPTGLFFTAKQLEQYDLLGSVKPDAKPVELSLLGSAGDAGGLTVVMGGASAAAAAAAAPPAEAKPASDRALVNLDDVEKAEELVAALQRFPVSVPTMLISGDQIADQSLRARCAAASAARKASNYWLTRQQASQRGLTLKAGAPFVELHSVSGGRDAAGAASAQSITGGRDVAPRRKSVPLQFYNAAQLADADLAFKIAGTK
jgi:hypothetical protein